MALGIGLGLGFGLGSGAAAAPGPAITSLNYVQGDTSGGGQSIVVSGTGLTGATVDIGGTAQTVTGTTSIAVTFTLVAKAAGTYTLTVTTANGSDSTSFEYWAPDTDVGCTLFCDANYAVVSTTGTWTPRHGSSVTNGAGTAPTASGGCPVFAGANLLRPVSNTAGLMTMGSPSSGSLFYVLTATAAASHSATLTNNPGLFADDSRGAIAACFDDAGFTFGLTDGSYKVSTTALAANSVKHVAVGRFSDGTNVGTAVDGSAWTETTIGTYSQATSTADVGRNYNGSVQLDHCTLHAMGFFSEKISDSTGTRIYRWAQQKWGVV